MSQSNRSEWNWKPQHAGHSSAAEMVLRMLMGSFRTELLNDIHPPIHPLWVKFTVTIYPQMASLPSVLKLGNTKKFMESSIRWSLTTEVPFSQNSEGRFIQCIQMHSNGHWKPLQSCFSQLQSLLSQDYLDKTFCPFFSF